MATPIEKLDLKSLDISEEQRAGLKKLFPEVFTEDGKVDFDKLRLTMGEAVDVGKERYGMNWPGKAECFKTIQQPSVATLVPCREESVNFDETENIFIEGDNLEVLKLLQKSYFGKIKMIYIDPPYNTGSDFIYSDDFAQSLETYLKYTGQIDAQGQKFSTNSEADGRFHSNWLNMMFPRLFLARNLLRDDGVIFISIDDNELDNLKKICNEIFGSDNFVGAFVWKRRASSALAEKLVSTDHEYVLCFQKAGFTSLGIAKQFKGYSNPDSDPHGDWTSGDLTVGMTREQRPNQFYKLIDPDTGREYSANPNRVWAYIPTSMRKLVAERRILFPNDPSKRPMLKRFKAELKSDVNPASTWLEDVGLNSEATRELQELLGTNLTIYPKPKSLVSALLSIAANKNDIVLDFFAGSGTTAHAVLELNQQDGGNRQFILVQLPERTDNKEFVTIAEITKERVRRIIKKLNDERGEKLALTSGSQPDDLGFKVFELQSSNFKEWNTDVPKDVAIVSMQLDLHVDHILSNRSQEDILYEILLKSGFQLSTKIETITLAGRKVFSIEQGAMFICLEHGLTEKVINAMAKKKPQRVVCLDEGFAGNDQLKTNAVQTMKASGVTSFRTV